MVASTLVDLVKINVINTGTGPLLLGNPIDGFRGVGALVDGDVYSYSIQQGSNYEAGQGVFDAATATLTRGVVTSSYGNVAIPLTSNAIVAFTALAQDFPSEGPPGPPGPPGQPANVSEFMTPVLQSANARAARQQLAAAPVGAVFYVDDFFLPGEIPGVGDNTRPLLAAHAAFVAAGWGASLRYSSPFYNFTEELLIPDDEYFWSILGQGRVTLRQCTPNTSIFTCYVKESFGLFTIRGFRFEWGTLTDGVFVPRPAVVEPGLPPPDGDFNPTGEVNSIGLCFKGSADVGPTVGLGIYLYDISDLHNENGFRCVSKALDADIVSPAPLSLWNGDGDRITNGPDARGLTWSTGATLGSPFVRSKGSYCVGLGLVEPMYSARTATGLRAVDIESNVSKNTQVVIDACQNVNLDGVRIENAELTFPFAELISLNGGMTNARVDRVDFTSIHNTGIAVGFETFGLSVFGGANATISEIVMSKGLYNPEDFYLVKPTPYQQYQSKVKFDKIPQYRFNGDTITARSYRQQVAPQIFFSDEETYTWGLASITALLDTNLSNGTPRNAVIAKKDGYIRQLTVDFSTPVSASQCYIFVWTRPGMTGSQTNVPEFYTFHQVNTDTQVTRYAIIPLDVALPGLPPITGHHVKKGDLIGLSIHTDSGFELTDPDGDILASLTVTYALGVPEAPEPTIIALELSSYDTATASFTATITSLPDAVLTFISNPGSLFTLTKDPDPDIDDKWEITGSGLTVGAHPVVIRETGAGASAGAVGSPHNNFITITRV